MFEITLEVNKLCVCIKLFCVEFFFLTFYYKNGKFYNANRIKSDCRKEMHLGLLYSFTEHQTCCQETFMEKILYRIMSEKVVCSNKSFFKSCYLLPHKNPHNCGRREKNASRNLFIIPLVENIEQLTGINKKRFDEYVEKGTNTICEYIQMRLSICYILLLDQM